MPPSRRTVLRGVQQVTAWRRGLDQGVQRQGRGNQTGAVGLGSCREIIQDGGGTRVARRKAMDRLKRDGALSREAIRRRLQWVAHDRKLAPAEITKAMRTRNIVAFCKKHGVSLDWVLYGNLQDHPKRSWERRTVLTSDEIRRAYESLGENDKAFISQYLSLLTKKGDAS
jgi:hypothetical protein